MLAITPEAASEFQRLLTELLRAPQHKCGKECKCKQLTVWERDEVALDEMIADHREIVKRIGYGPKTNRTTGPRAAVERFWAVAKVPRGPKRG